MPWLQQKQQVKMINSQKTSNQLGSINSQTVASRFFPNGVFNPSLLAEEIMRRHRFVTFEDNEETYVCNTQKGIYEPNGEALIKKEADDLLGYRSKPTYINSTLKLVKIKTYRKRKDLRCPENLIAVKNGLLDIEKMKLKPFTPDIFVLNQLPVYFDPNADCPNIKKFISEVVSPGDAMVLQELTGYCLWRRYPFHKAFMLLGEGRNGKTTFLNTLKALLGEENVSAIALQDLSNRFAAADLYGKLANICDDISDRDLRNTSRFKELTGESFIRAERKFRPPFYFVNSAKLIFSANKLPRSSDDTNAFFSRWIIIPFPNKFEEGVNADSNLLKKLTTPQELSGFLNWALEGLQRLRKNGKFSYSKTVNQVRAYMIKLSDSVLAFINERVVFDSKNEIPKQHLYSEYIAYCKNEQLVAVDYQTFCKRVLGTRRVSETRPMIRGKRIQCFKGLKLKHKP